MKALLLRTGSVPAQTSFIPSSLRISPSVHDSVAGVFSGNNNNAASPRISLHLAVNRPSIRRALSESDVIRPESEVFGGASRLSGVGSRSLPVRVPEEEDVSEGDEGVGAIGSLILTERGGDRENYAENWSGSGIPVEELGFSGGGIGKGRKSGGGSGSGDDFESAAFTGGNGDRSKIGAYYQQMLKSNPTNYLLLRNYAKFLHEVERDTVKAEEYYGRAILASPGDGEVLSLYGKLIWETYRDGDRAKSYFDQAVHACPDDCTVLGSYAHFMWEAEEDEEDEEIEVSAPAAMVEAF